MTMVEVRGINRIRKRLACGAVVEIHYAWRGKGAPAFWRSDSGIREGSPQYLAALTAATPKGEAARGLFREVIHGFLLSQDFSALAPRTQSDLRKSISHPKNGIDQKFGSGPLGISRDQVSRLENGAPITPTMALAVRAIALLGPPETWPDRAPAEQL